MIPHDEIFPFLFLTVWVPGILPAAYVARRACGNDDPFWIIPAMFWPISAIVLGLSLASRVISRAFDVLDRLPARAFIEIPAVITLLGTLLFWIMKRRGVILVLVVALLSSCAESPRPIVLIRAENGEVSVMPDEWRARVVWMRQSERSVMPPGYVPHK